jgi:2',3'-cyclic-nucleotide 2'-phosphodiesterase
MSKILFIGDIVGKGGRRVLREVLPQWKEKHSRDVTIVNVENMAHGKGVTPSTMAEIDQLDIDCYTSGNHIFKKNDLSAQVFEKYPNLIRPANFEGSLPGHGYYRFSKQIELPPSPSLAQKMPVKEGALKANDFGDTPPSLFEGHSPQKEREGVSSYNQQFLVLNLNAAVFMEKQFDGGISNPFLALDELLAQQGQKGDIIIVDFHSEATSEKIAFGLYCDGRVAVVLGTHTHVPTADNRILPNGTAYISDVGMTGARDGVIGVKYENVIKKFLEPAAKFRNEPEDEGVMQINGVLIEISADGKATKIERLHREE